MRSKLPSVAYGSKQLMQHTSQEPKNLDRCPFCKTAAMKLGFAFCHNLAGHCGMDADYCGISGESVYVVCVMSFAAAHALVLEAPVLGLVFRPYAACFSLRKSLPLFSLNSGCIGVPFLRGWFQVPVPIPAWDDHLGKQPERSRSC